MEGMIQRSSSQTDAIDSTNDSRNNNNNNNANNKNVITRSNFKPPLLPKPQIVKLNSGVHRAVKSNPASPEHVVTQNVSEISKSKHKTAQNEISLADKSDGTLIQKSPTISPKPQLPPKLNIINSSKYNSSLNKLACLSKSPSGFENSSPESTPVRPPRSVYRSVRKNESNSNNINENNACAAAESENNSVSSSEENACWEKCEELNLKVKDLVKDKDQLSEFCKQVEMCSRHSYLLKNDSDVHPPSKTLENRIRELELACGRTCMDGRAVTEKDSCCSANDAEKTSYTVVSCGPSNNINGYEVKELNNSAEENEKNLSRTSSDSLELPKSFLHQFVNSSNRTKESVESNEKEIVKNENVQSFLHRNKDEFNQKLSKSKSLGEHDRVKPDNFVQISKNDSIDNHNFTADKEQLFKQNHSKKSDSSNSDGGTSFSKRFPWFGSFGKGVKKEAGKKGRCVSQFYSSSIDTDEDILQERNRTKSLPDIKQARVAPERSFLLKNSETSRDSSITQISNDYPHSDSDDDKDSLNQIEFHSEKDSNARAYMKARELMTSEEVFIDVLKLLNVDFRNYVQFRNNEARNGCIPNAEVNKILNHLSQLQSLNEDILEDLKKRIENWETNPKISDVIVKKGAFLKMYTTYIQNFESQTNYLDECIMKYPKFGKILREFESLDRCKKLSLKHYMLKPVQRIPQYRLLLNDYLKHLDESSVDYADTLSALKIVCEVVDHANRNLAHGDKEGRLMHFQSILSDYVLIKPGRELIKDGPLEKICRKSVKDRYFILLNDCLLHTTYSKQYLKIHQDLPLSGMKVSYNEDEIYPHSFTVHSIKRSFILCAKTDSDCKEWVKKLRESIEEYIKRQKTFSNVKIEMNDSFKLGKEAPVWVPDSKVTMCQICTAEFTALFRRHHCRGCGKVICRNCGNNQAPLQYTNFKPDRVCDQCFDLLLKDFAESEARICGFLKETLNLNDGNVRNEYFSIKSKFIKYGSVNSLKKSKYIPPRLKEVPANDSESIISGWLHKKSRKSWKLFWYVLKDHVLYVYKASEDVLALETIPVLGYEVERVNINLEEFDKKLMFSLVHPSQTPIVFRAESQSSADRWFNALTTASSFDYLAI